MARPASKHPTELELEILKVLWEKSPLAVRDVRGALGPARRLAYTSVMTMMNIMVAKGYLAREKTGAVFLYRPKVTQKATTRRMLRDLLDRVFDGSASAILVNLLDSSDVKEEELLKLREIVNRPSAGSGTRSSETSRNRKSEGRP
jgi:BlaI family transcriptional regulator, penicillinase repressor